MNTIVIRKKWVLLGLIALLIGFGASYYLQAKVVPAFEQAPVEKNMMINMVTGEFKSKLNNGKEIEAYRWDPGTIFVPEGENVKLSIYGVNGDEHPFIIEGTDIKGTVKKGEETIITLKFDKEGIYRLICLKHPDIEHNGPMIAYIVVD